MKMTSQMSIETPGVLKFYLFDIRLSLKEEKNIDYLCVYSLVIKMAEPRNIILNTVNGP